MPFGRSPLSGTKRNVMAVSPVQKVLIVDDEVEITDLVCMVLEGDGRSLLVAYDGEEALDIVREERPHVVLTDMMMPRLDGRALCRAIRSDPSTRDTAIILMSAAPRINFDDCEADVLISKPFDIVSMADVVDRCLARSNLAQD